MTIYDRLIEAMAPGLIARRVVIGPHLSAVDTGQSCGLSSTLGPKGRPHMAPSIKEAGKLAGRPLIDLARMVTSERPMEASLAMAAINAGLMINAPALVEQNGRDLLADKARGKSLVMAGHFSFAEKLAESAGKMTILELDPEGEELPASDADQVIPEADLVAITASAFSNHTIEGLLSSSRDKWVMVMGPTSPLSPVLFDYGVDVVAGAMVKDVESTLRQIMEGAIFRQLRGVRRVMMIK